MTGKAHRTRIRLTALALSGCMVLSGAGPAFAQDEDAQSLPDPDNPAAVQDDTQRQDEASPSALPTTGLSAAPLVAAGLAVLFAGVAIRPVARRRRSWSTDAWMQAVRTGDSPPDAS